MRQQRQFGFRWVNEDEIAASHWFEPEQVPPPGVIVDDRDEQETLIDRLRELASERAWRDAEEVALKGRLVQLATEGKKGSEADIAMRSIVAEISCGLRQPERTVERQLCISHTMWTQFPRTLAWLRDGKIALQHAEVIASEGSNIQGADLETLQMFEDSLLERAAETTPGRLRSSAVRLAERMQGTTLEDRHRTARESRRVCIEPAENGMAWLQALLPAVLAHGIYDRITRIAKADRPEPETQNPSLVSEPGASDQSDSGTQGISAPATAAPDTDERRLDERRLDERRADVFCDILLAGSPSEEAGSPHAGRGHIQGQVRVTIPALSILSAGDDPDADRAELAGEYPIPMADALRLMAGAPSMQRILTHPVTGAVLDVDTYRVPKDLQRFLMARDERCRFPGCRMPACRSDLDHTKDWQYGGRSRHDNLAHLCRRHHTLKHASPWRVRQRAGGLIEWTSPLGTTYTDQPERHVVAFRTPAERRPASALDSLYAWHESVPEHMPF